VINSAGVQLDANMAPLRIPPERRPGAYMHRTMAALVVTVLACAGSKGVIAQDTVRRYLWQAGMARSEVGEVNVFRRFPAELRPAVEAFYGRVLALPALPPSAPGGGQMIRYPVGSSEVKLFPTAGAAANTAAVGAAAGVRLVTLFYADEASITRRFVDHGLPAPRFQAHTGHPGASRAALVQDPAGHWVQLVIVPGATTDALARFEIGLAAADPARSRGFYRDFLGLDELPAVHDGLLGATTHGFRHGSVTIRIWTADRGSPADAQTAGMQYIVWDAAGVNDVAQARGATIDRPLSAPGQMRTIWLVDPDGVSNYFAQFGGNDNTPPRP
jgi:hypothetical protein